MKNGTSPPNRRAFRSPATHASRQGTKAGFEAGVKPIDASIVETVLSRLIDDLEPELTRHGYDVRTLCEQFDAKPAEIRELLRGTLNPQRSTDLIEEMRAAGLPL